MKAHFGSRTDLKDFVAGLFRISAFAVPAIAAVDTVRDMQSQMTAPFAGIANVTACEGARGSYPHGRTVDGQVITGGPFTGSVTWPKYTCTNGSWKCSSFCGANQGRYFTYSNGTLVPVTNQPAQ